ncbi:hypothetical protein PV08_11725 [Exophiala spinifera]|uniref:Transcription factor domain-containing protein n=1 Tax=Exophiala spinifera TaxID=91928 RepID=A0A0D2BF28_9EURO|nr:uncharacterized protein PV08_11725 [Exophiala spinifera]KIW09949.1 hypothetical protein PV08_11725 [Exophiala spinifera]
MQRGPDLRTFTGILGHDEATTPSNFVSDMQTTKSKTHPVCMRCNSSRLTCTYDTSATLELPENQSGVVIQSASLSSAALPRENESQARSQRVSLERPTTRQNSSEKGRLTAFAGGRSVYTPATYWANPLMPKDSNEMDDNDDVPDESSNFVRWPPASEDHSGWAGAKFRPPRSSTLWTGASSNKCKFCGRNYNVSCVMALLPTREVCEKLCRLFFSTVFPLMPLLHLRSFGEDFGEFWEGTRTGNMHNSEPSLLLLKKPGFLCLLTSILFSALSSASKSRVKLLLGDSNVPDTGEMYFAAMVSASLTGFPRRPSIYSLAAYLFAQSQFVREEEFSDVPDFIATSFRLALGMGLHRQFSDVGFTRAEMETRRRVWWYILHLDVMSSASSGLSPLFIDKKMANTDEISPHDCVEGGSNVNTEVDVRYVVALQRYKVTKEIREVLKYHFEDHFQSLDQVNEVAKQLKDVANSVKSTVETLLRSTPASSRPTRVAEGQNLKGRPFDRAWSLRLDADDKEVVDFSAWAVFLLHLMVHKAYCVLYRPLFRDQAMSVHDVIRMNAIKHAQAFIQLFIRVCNDPSSEPYHWMYPGTYQPLQAVATLLADLLQHPHSDHAPLSRGLIDAVFELYRVDEGIVSREEPPQRQLSPAGKDAWTMLLRARRKALAQIGADHHVLHPSPTISSNSCICGDQIVQDTSAAPSSQQHSSRELSPVAPEESPRDLFHVEADQSNLSPGMLSQMNFDWRAWDNALDPSIVVSLQVARSNIAYPARILLFCLHGLGTVFGLAYNSNTPDLYPNTSHPSLAWTLWAIAIFEAVVSVVKSVSRSPSPKSTFHASHDRHPLMSSSRLFQDSDESLDHDRRSTRDPGESSPRRNLTFLPSRRQRRTFSWRTGWSRTTLSSRLVRIGASASTNLLITMIILAFVSFCTGTVTMAGIFKGINLFNGLAHFIKGGVFFFFGIVTVLRCIGCFSELGWAWNLKVTTKPPSRKPSRPFTMEGLECLLIFIYGITNVFLEHLSGWGGAWTAQDLEHVAISLLFIGGGACGLMAESRASRESVEDSLALEEKQNTIPGYSTNPVPTMIIFLLGVILGGHHQDTMESTMMHKWFGNFLTGASIMRAITYLLLYITPAKSTSPSRPPSELVTSFCLMSGGLTLMASNRDTVDAIIENHVPAMVVATVIMGISAVLMAWCFILVSIREWAQGRENLRTIESETPRGTPDTDDTASLEGRRVQSKSLESEKVHFESLASQEIQSASLEIQKLSLSLSLDLSDVFVRFLDNYIPRDQPLVPTGHRPQLSWLQAITPPRANDASLDSAILALSLVCLGRKHGDERLRREGTANYGRALHRLQDILSRGNLLFEEQTLASCMALSTFELLEVSGHNTGGWASHIEGIARLIQLRGPELHVSGLSHRLFLDFRSSCLTYSLATRRSTFLAQPDWLTVPWKVHPKSDLDRLRDMMAQLANLIAENERLDATADEKRAGIIGRGQELQSQLDTWHGDLTRKHPGPLYYERPSSAPFLSRFASVFPTALHFQNFGIARIMVNYWAVLLLLYNGIPAATDEFARRQRQVLDLARMIVQSMEYLISDDMRVLGPQTVFFALRLTMHVFTTAGEPDELDRCREVLEELDRRGYPFGKILSSCAWDDIPALLSGKAISSDLRTHDG